MVNLVALLQLKLLGFFAQRINGRKESTVDRLILGSSSNLIVLIIL